MLWIYEVGCYPKRLDSTMTILNSINNNNAKGDRVTGPQFEKFNTAKNSHLTPGRYCIPTVRSADDVITSESCAGLCRTVHTHLVCPPTVNSGPSPVRLVHNRCTVTLLQRSLINQIVSVSKHVQLIPDSGSAPMVYLLSDQPR